SDLGELLGGSRATGGSIVICATGILETPIRNRIHAATITHRCRTFRRSNHDFLSCVLTGPTWGQALISDPRYSARFLLNWRHIIVTSIGPSNPRRIFDSICNKPYSVMAT